MIRNAYTLVEMVAVTAILLVVLGVALIQFRPESAGTSPDRLLEEIRRAAASCRREAAATGTPRELVFEPEQRTVAAANERIPLPEGMKLRLNGEELRESAAILRFFPDGSAAEAELELESDEETAKLRVSPLTGSMEIDEDQTE